jgi:hypothetical protein
MKEKKPCQMSDAELIEALRDCNRGSGLIYVNAEALARLLEKSIHAQKEPR